MDWARIVSRSDYQCFEACGWEIVAVKFSGADYCEVNPDLQDENLREILERSRKGKGVAGLRRTSVFLIFH